MGEKTAEKENEKKADPKSNLAELQEKVGFLFALHEIRYIPGKGTKKGLFLDQWGHEVKVK